MKSIVVTIAACLTLQGPASGFASTCRVHGEPDSTRSQYKGELAPTEKLDWMKVCDSDVNPSDPSGFKRADGRCSG